MWFLRELKKQIKMLFTKSSRIRYPHLSVRNGLPTDRFIEIIPHNCLFSLCFEPEDVADLKYQ